MVEPLDGLADVLMKFGEMNWDEIGRGLAAMGAAMGETAIGGLLNTFSGIGASTISEIAAPLGTLADSVKKWSGVTVPEGLGSQLGILAKGVNAFTFSGLVLFIAVFYLVFNFVLCPRDRSKRIEEVKRK